MAPIKFDDHIREQLQEREIQPSDTAWEKLNTQLNQSSKKNKRTPWFAIAASVIGLVIVASLVFKNQINTIPDATKIVDANSNIIKEEVKKESIFKTEENELVVVTETTNEEENISETAVNSENLDVISANKTHSKKSELALNNSEEMVLEDPVQKSAIMVEIKMNTSETNFIKLKVAEVVAEVAAIKKSNKEISEDEINALLEKAQHEIQSQRIIANNKVDATALLNSVEEELETNFRDKVFDALGEQYEKVRTAVADRNN